MRTILPKLPERLYRVIRLYSGMVGQVVQVPGTDLEQPSIRSTSGDGPVHPGLKIKNNSRQSRLGRPVRTIMLDISTLVFQRKRRARPWIRP
jgi:hypothetical protein